MSKTITLKNGKKIVMPSDKSIKRFQEILKH